MKISKKEWKKIGKRVAALERKVEKQPLEIIRSLLEADYKRKTASGRSSVYKEG